MTIKTQDGKEVTDIAARFDITEDQAMRISYAASCEDEFVDIWENDIWWL